MLQYERPPEPDERPTAALVGLIMASFALVSVVVGIVSNDVFGLQPPQDVAGLMSMTTLLAWLLGITVAGIELWESRRTPSLRRRLALAGVLVGLAPVAVMVVLAIIEQ